MKIVFITRDFTSFLKESFDHFYFIYSMTSNFVMVNAMTSHTLNLNFPFSLENEEEPGKMCLHFQANYVTIYFIHPIKVITGLRALLNLKETYR